MSKRSRPQDERRCRATNKRGEQCAATVVGPDGFCSAHSGRQDMRELGRRGGKASRGSTGKIDQAAVPLSLRERLRTGLDRATVLAAIQRSLAGGNESARVAALKLLADLELYRQDGECPRCAQIKAGLPDARAKLARLVESRVENTAHWRQRQPVELEENEQLRVKNDRLRARLAEFVGT